MVLDPLGMLDNEDSDGTTAAWRVQKHMAHLNFGLLRRAFSGVPLVVGHGSTKPMVGDTEQVGFWTRISMNLVSGLNNNIHTPARNNQQVVQQPPPPKKQSTNKACEREKKRKLLARLDITLSSLCRG